MDLRIFPHKLQPFILWWMDLYNDITTRSERHHLALTTFPVSSLPWYFLFPCENGKYLYFNICWKRKQSWVMLQGDIVYNLIITRHTVSNTYKWCPHSPMDYLPLEWAKINFLPIKHLNIVSYVHVKFNWNIEIHWTV